MDRNGKCTFHSWLTLLHACARVCFQCQLWESAPSQEVTFPTRILIPGKDTLYAVFPGDWCVCVCLCVLVHKKLWIGAGLDWGSRTSYSRDCLRPLTARPYASFPFGWALNVCWKQKLSLAAGWIRGHRAAAAASHLSSHLFSSSEHWDYSVIHWLPEYWSRDHAYQCCCKKVESLD